MIDDLQFELDLALEDTETKEHYEPVKAETQSTGLSTLDTLLGNGFQTPSSILFTGVPGSGKSITALSYLYTGAKKSGEKVLYLSLVKPIDHLEKELSRFSMHLDNSDVSSRFIKDIISPEKLLKLNETLESYMTSDAPVRIVIDNVEMLFLYLDKGDVINIIQKAITDVQKHNASIVFVTYRAKEKFKLIDSLVDYLLFFNEFNCFPHFFNTIRVVKGKDAQINTKAHILSFTNNELMIEAIDPIIEQFGAKNHVSFVSHVQEAMEKKEPEPETKNNIDPRLEKSGVSSPEDALFKAKLF